MPESLERRTLAVQLADTIARDCSAGEWGDTLPGYRSLMKRYSVSSTTCLAAIALIEQRGLLAPAEHGKKRCILAKSKTRAAERVGNLLIICNGETPCTEDLLHINNFRSAWEDAGGKVRTSRFDFARFHSPDSILSGAVSSSSADAILLQVPPAPWVRSAVRIRPTFIYGGEHSGEPVTGVGYRVHVEVRRVVERLVQLGHERIAVPLDLMGPELEITYRNGLADGLGVERGLPWLKDYCPVFSEMVPAAWRQYWKALFANVRPTAIIVPDEVRVLSLYCFCAENGIVIPRDVSIISLGNASYMEWLSPVPTRMNFPVRSVTGYFKRWIRSGCKPLGMKCPSLEFVEASSVAPPRKH